MFTQKIKIDKKFIQDGKCYIVAEISANHNKNFQVLKKFLKDLKKTGVDAVKLQAYQANTITIDNKSDDFKIDKNPVFESAVNYENLLKAIGGRPSLCVVDSTNMLNKN